MGRLTVLLTAYDKDLIPKDVACCDDAGLSETAFPAA